MLGRFGRLPGFLRRWLDTLNRWWARLFGGGESEAKSRAVEAVVRRRAAFREFISPLDEGPIERRDWPRWVVYTFEALEAWGADAGLPRSDHETAQEYARRLADEYAEVAALAGPIGLSMTFLLYGGDKLPAATGRNLERFWREIVDPPAVAEVVEGA